jgi:hypothetical protein
MTYVTRNMRQRLINDVLELPNMSLDQMSGIYFAMSHGRAIRADRLPADEKDFILSTFRKPISQIPEKSCQIGL